ncbi:hypothetical protein BDC45DRAFT_610164 [Circinella umbellata]|nr:hypothetical protein BDC45DRAFT_610164 [Circinella umbellata]
MYSEYHTKMSFIPSTTLKKPLRTTPTVDKPLIDSSPKNYIMTNSNNSNNNNSNDKTDQEYSHNNISDTKMRIMKDNREEEREEKRSSAIMTVTAITNNDSSTSKRSPSFEDLQKFFRTGPYKLPKINDLNKNNNNSGNGLLSFGTFESSDNSHEEEKGKGYNEFPDFPGSERDMIPLRHHSAPASTCHQYYQKQHLNNTLDHHRYHQYYDSSITSISDSSTISSASSSSSLSLSSLSLSSTTLDSDKACPTCSKTFSRSRDRARHINSVHKAYKINKCKSCGCCFTRMDSLLRHQRNKTCINVNARSSPSSPTPFFRKGAVYGTTMALPSPPEFSEKKFGSFLNDNL